MRRHRSRLRVLVGLAVAATFVFAGGVARADAARPVSAHDAAAALQRGALAWDVRTGASTATPGGVLPGTVRVDPAALDRWLADGDVGALARAVSAAGLDLSRDVVIYGEPGDPRAQALAASLERVAGVRVLWLVGGTAEWQAHGLPLDAAASARLPVPQWLVLRDDAPAGAMAAPHRRDGATAELVARLLSAAAPR